MYPCHKKTVWLLIKDKQISFSFMMTTTNQTYFLYKIATSHQFSNYHVRQPIFPLILDISSFTNKHMIWRIQVNQHSFIISSKSNYNSLFTLHWKINVNFNLILFSYDIFDLIQINNSLSHIIQVLCCCVMLK